MGTHIRATRRKSTRSGGGAVGDGLSDAIEDGPRIAEQAVLVDADDDPAMLD